MVVLTLNDNTYASNTDWIMIDEIMFQVNSTVSESSIKINEITAIEGGFIRGESKSNGMFWVRSGSR